MFDFPPAFFRSLQQLKIRTRRAVLGSRQGSHRSNRRGYGLEFADHRQYAPGDDFRYIDWGVLGKTDRLYVREYREEQDLNVVILVDGSMSMRTPAEKYEFAASLALSIGYVALADGDALQLSLLGRGRSPRFRGPRAFSRARQFFTETLPAGNIDLVEECRRQTALTKMPGKCFFISDFLFPHETVYRALDLLRGRNFDLTLVQVLSPQEISLPESPEELLLVDSENGQEQRLSIDREIRTEYGKRLANHIRHIESYAERSGIVHTLISSGDDLAKVVLQRFPELKLLE